MIASDPLGWLGEENNADYGARLPTLLKVLGIGEPLSLQAHPSTAQAEAGLAREDALGIDRAAPHRSYRDDRAKPEMICALTDMDVLCGFRDLAESQALLRTVGGPLLPFAEQLRRPEDLPGIVGGLLSLDRAGQYRVVAAITDALAFLPRYVSEVVGKIADRYPDDAGVAVALLLNATSLEPGDALYLPAGNLHAYLRGLGVEVMASSDNVLRGGLTPKHVDVPELVKTLGPVTGPWPMTVAAADPAHPGVEFYRSPSPEVGLARIALTGPSIDVPVTEGPTLLLVTDGTIRLESADRQLSLSSGQAAYGMPCSHVRVSGNGVDWVSQLWTRAEANALQCAFHAARAVHIFHPLCTDIDRSVVGIGCCHRAMSVRKISQLGPGSYRAVGRRTGRSTDRMGMTRCASRWCGGVVGGIG